MGRGGAERTMLNLANGFQAEGYPVEFVAMRRLDEPRAIPHLPVSYLGVDRASSSVQPLARYLREKRPEVLISNLYHTNVAAVLAKHVSRSRTRLLLVNHNPLSVIAEHAGWRNKAMPYAVRVLYPKADRIIAVSQGVADDIIRTCRFSTGKVNVYVAFNPAIGPDLESQARESVDEPILRGEYVLAVGSLNRQKDFSMLLRAFAQLLESRPSRLLILGEGGQRRALENLMRDLEIEESVAMPGNVDNPYPYMARARLFVLSSLWEGLPTVLIEAMALGTPVVATDCLAGPSEILQGGKWGTLVAPGNYSQLSDAMLEMLQSPIVPPPEACQRFTLGATTRRYLELAFG